jgi:hypothetical protein
MTKAPIAQHSMIFEVTGKDERGRSTTKDITMYAPPFLSLAQLEAHLAEAIRLNPDLKFVHKSWAGLPND